MTALGVEVVAVDGAWIVEELTETEKGRRYRQVVGGFPDFRDALALGHDRAQALGVLLMVTGGAA